MKNQILATGRKLLGPNREYESRIERHQSPLKILLVPILSVMAGSMITAMPLFADEPLLPPIGFLMIGLPLGMFDDLYSGQPFGSAAFLWSLTMLAIEVIDSRAIWRDHMQDWFLAAAAILLVLIGGVAVSGLAHWAPELKVILPQIILSILVFPLVVRLCARLDNWRLAA